MSKEIKKLNFTSVGDGIYELDVEEKVIEKIEVKPVSKTKINLWMDSEMHRQLKMAAAEEEITVTSILCKGARNYLNQKNTREMRDDR